MTTGDGEPQDGDEPEEEEEPEGKKKEEEKPVTQKDLAALTSKHQTELAEANKTIKDLSKSRADLEVRLQALQEEAEDRKSRVEIDEDTPPEKVKETVNALQDQVKTFRQMATGTFNAWVDEAAGHAAYRLLAEYGDLVQVDSLKRKFAEIAKTNPKGLENAVKEVEIDLKEERAKATPEKSKKPKYDETVPTHRTPTRLIDEIKGIDVTTPEGRAEWEKRKAAFAKQAGLPVPP